MNRNVPTGCIRLHSGHHAQFRFRNRGDGLWGEGPNLTISTACSSSAHALGQAIHTIRAGTADAVIVVGADASITPLVFASFARSGALDESITCPESLPSLRPWTGRVRDGRRRRHSSSNRRPMPEAQGSDLCGSGRVCRHERGASYGHPREDGESRHDHAARTQDAGRHAGAGGLHQRPRHVDIGRRCRGGQRLFAWCFKSRADKLAVNATKSLVGHTLGAAGSLAGVVSALTLTSGQIHRRSIWMIPTRLAPGGPVERTPNTQGQGGAH